MKRLLFIWKRLFATFWFTPSLVIFAAIILVVVLLRLDNAIDINADGIGRFFFVNSLESARNILTTISGAMIGVAGTVFSMTLVAITLTSSQLGSRQIKNFMYDRLNQVVLGSYISTFVCCLIILNSLNKYEDTAFIPYISIMFATLLAVVNIILLIVFIHHVAISIQADTVVSQISTQLSSKLDELFPKNFGESKSETWTEERLDTEKKKYKISHKFNSIWSGYIQYIDMASLIEKTAELDILIELDCRPGDFVVEGVDSGTLYSKEILSEKQLKAFNNYFYTGKTRTNQQDAEHSIHQLVEVACRALSPGINDPYTAIACIDNLTKSMVYLTTVNFPSKYRYDKDENLRLIVEPLTYEGILNAAFNQIRQFSSGMPAVVIRQMESLITIHEFVTKETHKSAVKRHAEMVLRVGQKSFPEPNDVKDLEERAKQILDETKAS